MGCEKNMSITTPSGFEVRSVTSIDQLSAEAASPDGFAARDNIEISADWFALLQKNVYPADSGVRYYYVAKDDYPVALLPLRLTRKGRVRTVESLGNYYTSLYAPLLTKQSNSRVIRDMLEAAARDHGGAHVMRFAPMDPESCSFKGIHSELQAIGWIPFKFFCFGNWFLKANDDWDSYLKKRSANLRSAIKRRKKEFSAAGGSLEVVTDLEGIEQAIEAFQEVYSASWKIPEPYPDFVPSLIRLLAANGMLRLGIARLDQKPVAAQLWIVAQDKASIYKLAYHEAYASFSPGTVLTSHLMQHVIEHDHVREVDFLTGDDSYKRIWMSNRRERWGIIAYNPRTIIGLVLLAKEALGRRAKSIGKVLKRTPWKTLLTSRPAYLVDMLRKTFHTNAAQRDQQMTWTIYPIARLAEYSPQWDALVQSRAGTPFLECAFVQPLIDVFGTGEERLCLLRSHPDGNLRAAAIMQRGRKGRWQTFQPSQLPLGALVLDGNIDFLKACCDLTNKLPGITLGIGLSQLDSRLQPRPEDSPSLRTQDYIQTAWVDIDGSFEAYWDARGKNLKQNTRKQRNKLLAEGIETRIECITRPEDVPKAIEDYGVLESAGWKAADGTAILPDNDQGRFYRIMFERFCTEGRGRIYRYWFGEKVVAMDLCIHDDEAIVILKTAYDESFKTVSPSTLMRQEEFQQLFEEKRFARIEFYGKVMEWHTRWTTQSRAIYHATSYRWAWLKRLHARMSATQEPKESSTESEITIPANVGAEPISTTPPSSRKET